MQKYRKIKLNMRKGSLDTLIEAYLSSNAPSRTSVCRSTGVCNATASKVANALVESGFMCERLFSADGKERPRAHLFLKDSLRILMIDLSTPIFSMKLVSGDASTLFESTHSYDPSVTADDNLNIFLSRCGLEIKRSGYSFSAISVIYADLDPRRGGEIDSLSARLPSIAQKSAVSHAVYEIMRKRPDTHLTVSEAISMAMRLSLGGDTVGGASYIFVGSQIRAFHCHPNGYRTVCSPERLLSSEEKRLLRYMPGKDETDEIFARLCVFMDAAFSPSRIVLESDRCAPDGVTSRRINRAIALSGGNAPLLFIRSDGSDCSMPVLGALRSTALSLIKSYITST